MPIPGNDSGRAYTRASPLIDRLERGTVAHDWIPRDTRTMNRLARLIYLTDPVAGPAIDFYREIPFGPVILAGVKDKNRQRFYNDALDALNLSRYLPYLAGDILTVGRLITHLILNESVGYWDELIVHDSDYILVEPSPIIGEEPTIDLIVPQQYRKWATSTDPRVVKQRAKLDKRLVRMMAAGNTIPLDPENTIFVPRRMSANDDLGTSLVMRIITIITIEWAYLQAETTGLRRRAAPWTVVNAGIEDKWEPTPDELLAIQDMLMAAEEDPVGAKLVFRNGIEMKTEGGHSEIAKWLDHWDTLKAAKLQGLGMNEAFATGEASWSYLESMLSLGMERIRNFRRFIAEEVIMEGILAPLARLNGFYRRTQSELDHRIRTSSRVDANLDVPTVEWSRSLQPTSDKDYLDILSLLEEKGLPVNLRKWAQSGGYDIDEALEGIPEDLELRKKLAKYKADIAATGGATMGLEGSMEAAEHGKQSDGEEGTPEGGEGETEDGYNYAMVMKLPHWNKQGEFLELNRSDAYNLLKRYVPRHATLDTRAWKQCEQRMLDSGVRKGKTRALQYLLRRAGVTNAPMSVRTVAKIRDHFLRQANGKPPNRWLTTEIGVLNHELERSGVTDPIDVAKSVIPNVRTAGWVKPCTPKLLTGEGN